MKLSLYQLGQQTVWSPSGVLVHAPSIKESSAGSEGWGDTEGPGMGT